MTTKTFGSHLKQLRTNRDLTQVMFAEQIGCAVITLKQFESGRRRPSRQMLERMAHMLQLEANERTQFIRFGRKHAALAIHGNPYLGLAPFGEQDADRFFGREAMLDRLLAQMRRSVENQTARFLAIVGSSGSGKSSLMCAGLVPLLQTGAIPGSERWKIVLCTPGSQPMYNLERVLPQLASSRKYANQLLLIDQFEELFSLCTDEQQRTAFLDRIVEITTQTAYTTWIIITLRADFFDWPLHYRSFGGLLREHCEVVLPLSPAEIERAIVAPAEQAEVVVEQALVATLISDVEARPGMLPLLQYMLTELFDHAEGARLTLAGYHRLGGIAGVITRRADVLLASLSAEQQTLTQQAFLRLVQPIDTIDTILATRRRVMLREMAVLSESLPTILERFAQYRLLTMDRDPLSSEATVEIAHEVLIHEWNTLNEWLQTHRNVLVIHRRLAQAISDWQESGNEESLLATGLRLIQFAELAQQADVLLTDTEQHFVAASLAKYQQERYEAQAREARLTLSLKHSEALRLASESNRLRLSFGSAELIALLALQSLEYGYTPQGDEALTAALLLDLPIRRFSGDSGRIYVVAYAPSGELIATGGQDMTVRLWHVATGSLSRELTGHTRVIRLLTFSADGAILASLSDDQTVRIWHVVTGSQLHCITLIQPTLEEVALDISPDGRLLLIGGESVEAQVWDIATGTLVVTLATPDLTIRWLKFLPDSQSCLILTRRGVYQWNLASSQLQHVLEHQRFGRAALLICEDQLLLALGIGAQAQIWNLTNLKHVATASGHTEVIESLVADPTGHRIGTVSNDGTARIWDAETGREERRFIAHNNVIWSAAFAPTGDLLLTGGGDGVACLWDVHGTHAQESIVRFPAPVHAVAYLPDGASIVLGCGDRRLRHWDCIQSTERPEFSGIASTMIHGSMACSPDGSLVATGSNDGTAYVWHVSDTKLVQQLLAHDGRIWAVAISPDNRILVTTGSDGFGRLWNIESGVLIRELHGHTEVVIGACFSPDGRYVLTGSEEPNVRLWDVETGQEVQRFRDPNGPMMQVDYHPNGKQILTGSADGTVRIWDIANGAVLQSLVGHQGYVYSATFSADGSLILSCAGDRTTRIWDAASGRELRRLVGHTSVVFDAAMSSDMTQIVTVSYDQTIRFWDTDYHAAAATLKSRLLRDFTAEEQRVYRLND